MNKYIGHDSQVYGIEEHRLVGGKGDGMRLLQVRNGKGLDFTVAVDRCADIYRLSFKGINMGFFSPAGYVAPAYYDEERYFKTFTAGFMTTCGLTNIGIPCEDNGEKLPLHGTVGTIPAEQIWWEEAEGKLIIHAVIRDEMLFSHKLTLYRDIVCYLDSNRIEIHDKIVNRGDTESPIMFLYHMNMGYPLLSEHAEVYIASDEVIPRNERAAEGLATWNKMLEPQEGFVEQCYFHKFSEKGEAGIFNPDINLGLVIRFDPKQLPYFTQWKMMGVRDYALGLEPGNAHPDGRDKMRRDGELTILQPGESICFDVAVDMIDSDCNSSVM